MKASILSLLLVPLFLQLNAQRPPIEGLPAIGIEDAGFNMDTIRTLIPIMDDFVNKDFRGMVVIKEHQVVMEWYYNSTQRNTINDVRSAGKGITAILLGVAIEQGFVQSIEQDVHSFFSKEKYPSLHDDFKRIKIKDLLDMTSGLNADADDWETPGNAGMWISKDNWTDYILSIPLVREPGEKWIYADISPVLIGAIIQETSGLSLRDFAVKYVFEPLQITEYYWFTNASNQTGAAGNLYLSTLDFAKLGVLVANDGKWVDQQLADAAYIERMKTHKIPHQEEYWPLSEEYGMFWYKNKLNIGDKEFDYLFASGLGGNHLVVVPEHNLVVSLTATAYGQWYGHARAFFILKKLLGAHE